MNGQRLPVADEEERMPWESPAPKHKPMEDITNTYGSHPTITLTVNGKHVLHNRRATARGDALCGQRIVAQMSQPLLCIDGNTGAKVCNDLMWMSNGEGVREFRGVMDVKVGDKQTSIPFRVSSQTHTVNFSRGFTRDIHVAQDVVLKLAFVQDFEGVSGWQVIGVEYQGFFKKHRRWWCCGRKKEGL